MTQHRIPEAFTVGSPSGEFDDLVYMLPAGKTERQKEKVRESILRWNRNCKFVDIENKPRKGFKIVGYASRYSTSNKLICVKDPEGFTAQIPVSNLLQTIPYCTIEKGEIQTECLWAKEGATLIMLSMASPAYSQVMQEVEASKAVKKAKKKIRLKPGDIFKSERSSWLNGYGQELIYLGKANVETFFMHPLDADRHNRFRSLFHLNHGDRFTWAERIRENPGSVSGFKFGEVHLYCVNKEYGPQDRIQVSIRKTPPSAISTHSSVREEVLDELRVNLAGNPIVETTFEDFRGYSNGERQRETKPYTNRISVRHQFPTSKLLKIYEEQHGHPMAERYHNALSSDLTKIGFKSITFVV